MAAMTGISSLFHQWRISLGNTSWFHRAYVVDWAMTGVLFFLAEVAVRWLHVYERDFSIDDPLISHPSVPDQVPGFANWYISVAFPIGFVIYFGFQRGSTHEMHHGALGCWLSYSIANVVTKFLKNRVGRLRPDFLARCSWSLATRVCVGPQKDVLNGRLSFPSGHSSTAWSGLGFLFFFLAGKTGACCISAPLYGSGTFSSRLLRMLITVAPLCLAAWIAITRVEDYKHHKEDVIVGSLIGFLSAWLSYTVYWENPFSTRVYLQGASSQARLVYDSNTAPIVSAEHYELAPYEDDQDLEGQAPRPEIRRTESNRER